MGRLQYGLDDARQAAGNMVDSVRAGKEQLINYLGTIGTLGPMIGLVGTVYGMIQSFMALSGQRCAGEVAVWASGWEARRDRRNWRAGFRMRWW